LQLCKYEIYLQSKTDVQKKVDKKNKIKPNETKRNKKDFDLLFS